MEPSNVKFRELFIVVIDDSETICHILEGVLEREGHQVKCFQHPIPALHSILKTGATPRPDLLFIDISMPALSGYETARLFNSHLASMHIPIIVISRLDDTVARLRARLAGATEYLAKPFQVQDVLALVQRFASPPNPPKN